MSFFFLTSVTLHLSLFCTVLSSLWGLGKYAQTVGLSLLRYNFSVFYLAMV